MKQLICLLHSSFPPVLSEPLYAIHKGEVAAVIKELEWPSLAQVEYEALLQKIEEQQQIVAELLPHYPLLPIQFGSFLENNQQIERLLEVMGVTFLERMNELGRCESYDLYISWDSPAGVRVDGREAQLALAKQQKEVEEVVLPLLQKVGECHLKGDEGLPEMVLGVVLLVHASQKTDFLGQLETVQQTLGNEYQIEWQPGHSPYLFHEVKIRAPKLHLVNYATELLQVGEQATLDELKLAFHQHPQYNRPENLTNLEELVGMTELAQAYKLLCDITQKQGGNLGRFDPEAIAHTFFITW